VRRVTGQPEPVYAPIDAGGRKKRVVIEIEDTGLGDPLDAFTEDSGPAELFIGVLAFKVTGMEEV
jgi:hypothetical protein